MKLSSRGQKFVEHIKSKNFTEEKSFTGIRKNSEGHADRYKLWYHLIKGRGSQTITNTDTAEEQMLVLLRRLGNK